MERHREKLRNQNWGAENKGYTGQRWIDGVKTEPMRWKKTYHKIEKTGSNKARMKKQGKSSGKLQEIAV
jgi:hypothetical protein